MTDIHYVPQRTPEWYALRLGKVTASRVDKVCDKIGNGNWAKGRTDYKTELILERLTGRPADFYESQDMINGRLREPDARSAYELFCRCEVQQVGFVDHPQIPMAGGSPDGFVGDNGMIEIKCPKASTHMGYLRAGVFPSAYKPQVMWNLACSPERKWCDFISFHPDFPPPMDLFVIRVERNDGFISLLEDQVADFLEELDREVEALRMKYIERQSPALAQLNASVEEMS